MAKNKIECIECTNCAWFWEVIEYEDYSEYF